MGFPPFPAPSRRFQANTLSYQPTSSIPKDVDCGVVATYILYSDGGSDALCKKIALVRWKCWKFGAHENFALHEAWCARCRASPYLRKHLRLAGLRAC